MNRPGRPFSKRDLLDRIIPLAKQHGITLEKVAEALGVSEDDVRQLWDDAAPEPQPVQRED